MVDLTTSSSGALKGRPPLNMIKANQEVSQKIPPKMILKL